jgi:RES domain-containing protein
VLVEFRVASEPLTLLPEAPSHQVAFRWSTYDVPFWARPNSRPGRWNRVDGTSTQYWSLTPEAAWCELIRQENLTTDEELELVRMPMWVCRVLSGMVVDLRQPLERERFGITDEELIDDNWDACQDLVLGLRDRYRAVIAPCAALPHHANITMFGPRRAIGWHKSPALSSVIPATRVAIGRPPEGLLESVRRPAVQPHLDRLF